MVSKSNLKTVNKKKINYIKCVIKTTMQIYIIFMNNTFENVSILFTWNTLICVGYFETYLKVVYQTHFSIKRPTIYMQLNYWNLLLNNHIVGHSLKCINPKNSMHAFEKFIKYQSLIYN